MATKRAVVAVKAADAGANPAETVAVATVVTVAVVLHADLAVHKMVLLREQLLAPPAARTVVPVDRVLLAPHAHSRLLARDSVQTASLCLLQPFQSLWISRSARR